MRKNIFELSAVDNYKTEWQEKKSVLVGGCFDLLHIGHVSFLKKAKDHGDFLIVALESDSFIKTYKNRDPIHNQAQRAEILSEMKAVDYVITLPRMNGNTSYFSLVKQVAPAIIAVTEGDPYLEIKQQQAQLVGGQVKVVCPPLSTFSTTNILYETLFSD